ncbi:MAG: hypothetical protein JWP06_661 [Candidatus Saccharibacteria bacterium]|nr:hypothetical protein [Candidatus Saccharibacteria bacterium]
MSRKDAEAEDLAIQDTLAMSVEERLKLLANLIVDKVEEDIRNGQPLFKLIAETRND